MWLQLISCSLIYDFVYSLLIFKTMTPGVQAFSCCMKIHILVLYGKKEGRKGRKGKRKRKKRKRDLNGKGGENVEIFSLPDSLALG